jgi:hypothetical protein
MNIPNWLVVLFGLILIGIIVGLGYQTAGKNEAVKQAAYEKARADSIQNALVFSDTTHSIEIAKLKRIIGQKPASITIHKVDTLWKTADTLASVWIDTTLQTVNSDTSKVCEVPFKGSIVYSHAFNMFFYDFDLGTIRETRTIKQSNVVNLPPFPCPPAGISNLTAVEYGLGGLGLGAAIGDKNEIAIGTGGIILLIELGKKIF